jgi:hypothetical protein
MQLLKRLIKRPVILMVPHPLCIFSDNLTDSNGVGASDTGAQRPIFLNTEQISAFAGFDTKVLYRSNPLTLSGDLTQTKTGIWQNSFYGGASLSPIDTDTASLDPRIWC